MTIVAPVDLRRRPIDKRFRWWEDLRIKNDLLANTGHFVPCLVNVLGDLNLGSAVRSSNWFGMANVIIAGKKHWDRRSAVGVYNYLNIDSRPEIEPVIEEYRAKGYTIVAAETGVDAVPLPKFEWPEHCLVLFGEEGNGLDSEVLKLADFIVEIPGRGSARSLNVSATASIFLYTYAVQRGYI